MVRFATVGRGACHDGSHPKALTAVIFRGSHDVARAKRSQTGLETRLPGSYEPESAVPKAGLASLAPEATPSVAQRAVVRAVRTSGCCHHSKHRGHVANRTMISPFKKTRSSLE